MRKKAMMLMACLAYYTGIVNLFYWLNRRYKRIITFHNVLPEKLLPNGCRIGIIDTEEEFQHIVAEVRSKFKINNDIYDLSSAVITFDDGYLNQVEIVKPILKKFGDIKPIIFCAGKLIDSDNAGNALIVDLLMHWTHLAPEGRYTLPASFYPVGNFELGRSNRLEIWQSVIWPAFNADAMGKGENVLNCLNSQYPIDGILGQCCSEYISLRLHGLSRQVISEMRGEGWLFGWHTINHYPLSRLSPEEQGEEIASCGDREFERVPFSYPYGEMASVTPTSLDLASRSGYGGALSNLPYPNAMSSNWFLPRFTLNSNKYLLHFELSGLKYFIQTGKLLRSNAHS